MNRYLITYQYPNSEPVAMIYEATTEPTMAEALDILGPPAQRAEGTDDAPTVVSVEPLDTPPVV